MSRKGFKLELADERTVSKTSLCPRIRCQIGYWYNNRTSTIYNTCKTYIFEKCTQKKNHVCKKCDKVTLNNLLNIIINNSKNILQNMYFLLQKINIQMYFVRTSHFDWFQQKQLRRQFQCKYSCKPKSLPYTINNLRRTPI